MPRSATMPTLSGALADQMDVIIGSRGARYFASGAVRNLRGDERSASARVHGSRTYTVEVEYERREKALWASCTCPHCADDGNICKHIWATLLAADAEGLLAAVSRRPAADILLRGWDEDSFGRDADPRDEFDDILDDGDPPIVEVLDARAIRDFKSRLRFDQLNTAGPAAAEQGSSGSGSASWKRMLNEIRDRSLRQWARHITPAPLQELLYIINRHVSERHSRLCIELATRQRKTNGEWGKLKYESFARVLPRQLPDTIDQKLVALIQGSDEPGMGYGWYGQDAGPASVRYFPPPPLLHELISQMAATGRCMIRAGGDDQSLRSIRWDAGEPWRLRLALRAAQANAKHYELAAEVVRHDEARPLESAQIVVAGLIGFDEVISPLNLDTPGPWLSALRSHGRLRASSKKKLDDMLADLAQTPGMPPVEADESIELSVHTPAPTPQLTLRSEDDRRRSGPGVLDASVSFGYDGIEVQPHDPRAGIYERDLRRLIRRDFEAERRALQRLMDLGFREPSGYQPREPGILQLAPKRMAETVRTLLGEGWQVQASGRLIRTGGSLSINVSSGIDWFELNGAGTFDDRTVPLPELLKAIRRGENMVRLDDGSLGLLPEQWLEQYQTLAAVGAAGDDNLRFARAQVGLLDAMLAAMPEVSCDAQFAAAREQLRRFERIEPADPPASFSGTLRPYQRDGLGWLAFLRDFGFGGCLADDMGLGKTIQVLALLDALRVQRESAASRPRNSRDVEAVAFAGGRPSLVVAPRSLIFNWMQEAARFTPNLRVLDHTGLDRGRDVAAFAGFDVVLTTYGTLRRDAALLKDVEFEYAILDEAQAIKNAGTASAKAARLLRAEHRLALSGTPIENHLGELWSIFEFLNPGMLGRASALKLGAPMKPRAGSDQNDARVAAGDPQRALLARAVRPFILRRTKSQVARDLPQRTEHTIYCELDSRQRKVYNELRDHYRQSLLGRIERQGLAKSKIHVLEALLRLRQAACHPGLIDPKRRGHASAKLDSLLPQLQEVLDEGHKALVFSQFTSMLAIVRDRLDKQKIAYEYLDGKTRDRATRVSRFQDDPDCRLFLISLKAGGLGLNLTAAEYVFLLDPWWNPAVEAQAIDRAHRIGQMRHVFAYRLIARDTVEERVLELQQTKRALADSIINADDSLIRTLKREDLELLLR